MLSPLSRIDIGHDNSGPGAGWFLDRVSTCCHWIQRVRASGSTYEAELGESER